MTDTLEHEVTQEPKCSSPVGSAFAKDDGCPIKWTFEDTPLVGALSELCDRYFNPSEVSTAQKPAPSSQVLGSGIILSTPGGNSEVTNIPVPEKAVTDHQLTTTVSNTGVIKIFWSMPELKLNSTDKIAVSPSFEVPLCKSSLPVKFKLMMIPQTRSEGRHESSFKKCKGKVSLELKCEEDLTNNTSMVNFKFFVGSQPPRGPVNHNFSQSAVSGLPKKLETWDLTRSVSGGRFTVGAEFILQ